MGNPFGGGGKMGRNSTQTGAGGPMGTGGASSGRVSGPADRGGFNRGAKRRENILGQVSVDARTPVSTPGKTTANGSKPGEDAQAVAQAQVPFGAASDVEKAVIEARRQRAALAPGVQTAETILGMMPAPMGTGLALGNWMGKKTEDDAAAHPENYRTNLKDPGSLYSKSGPVSTNRAVSGPAAKANSQASSATGEVLKKKKQALPTLLGAPAQALGTFSNPVQIT